MVCPICPTAGFFGGLLGSYLGIKTPTSFKGRCLSMAATGSLVAITLVSVKIIFNFSLCAGKELTLSNSVILLAKTLAIGVIYAIGVNYLISRYFEQPASQTEVPQVRRSCCSQRSS
ncbi:MAG: hypothetical protein H0V82_00330 [Candidatus Protochlamydia sp.]|nr:hypothetical protein [Candidatus Protochlamydia sp.]